MQQQSPVNIFHPMAQPCFDIRLCLWTSWGVSLPVTFMLLLLSADGTPLPVSIALPFPPVVHLILMSTPLLLLLLSRGALLDRTARSRSLLTMVLAVVGLELYATLLTIFERAAFDIATDQPMPVLAFLFIHRHSLLCAITLLVLLCAFLHGLALSGDWSDAGATSRLLLRLYIVTRPLFGVALGFPLEPPVLAYLVITALPLGLALGALPAIGRPRLSHRPPRRHETTLPTPLASRSSSFQRKI